MPICKTDAIVLKSYRHGETSKIAILYTKAFGKTKVIAKGARTPKSRFGAALEAVTEAAIVFYRKEGRDVHTLSQADLLCPFSGVKSSLGKLAFASAIVEQADHLATNEEPSIRLYRLLKACLEGVEREPERVAEKFLWHFQLHAAELMGYRPQLGRCIRCGGPPGKGESRLDLAGGGIVCQRCSQSPLPADEDRPEPPRRYVDLHGESAAFMRKLQNARPDAVGGVTTRSSLKNEIREALRAFLVYHTGDRRGLRSLDFLTKLKQDLAEQPLGEAR